MIGNSKLRRRLAGIGIAIAAVGVLSAGFAGPSQAASGDNPQLKPGSAAAAPSRCASDIQSRGTDRTTVNLTNNVPYTLPVVAGWQVLKCTTSVFYVPRGQTALVTASYSGEFDASGPTGNTGWVQNRIRFASASASILSTYPDNDGRGDSFALDASKGLSADWSAHINVQSTKLTCSPNITAATCAVRVWAEGQLTAGADYFWYDDSTLHVEALFDNARNGVTVRNNSVTP